MDKVFWAKSEPKQTVQEHTANALALYRETKLQYQNYFDDAFWEILRLCVLYHDCGKVDENFRSYIDAIINKQPLPQDGGFIHHNYLSPAFLPPAYELPEINSEDYNLLIKSIYYHHARKSVSASELNKYIKEQLETCREGFEMEGLFPIARLNTKFISKLEFAQDSYGTKLRYIKLKGMLNRIDYAASAMRTQLDMPLIDEENRTIGQATVKYMERNQFAYRTVQKYMSCHTNSNLIVTAATGIGKTEAALLWIKDQKSFYTLPLTVSSNAIYDRIVNKIEYRVTGILHSDAQRIYRENQEKPSEIIEDPYFQYESAKLFSFPLTICTIDQILKFVYKYNGGEAAAATLSYSKLVIDEIQMYSPNLVATILAGLKMIVDMGGKFAIITATFPPVLFKLMNHLQISPSVYEKSPTFHSEYTHRHKIKLLTGKEFDYEAISEMGKKKKVLIIVNTVKEAQKVYEKILKLHNNKSETVGLLHGSFIKQHRGMLEREILRFASNSQKERPDTCGIWISTQIVEASLDLDFDILFTEMCTIDSLLQRMGRVFRSRIYSGEEPNVFILDNKNGVGIFIDSEIYGYSLNAIKAFDGSLLEESEEKDDKQKLIDMVYDDACNPELWNSKYRIAIQKKAELLLNLPMYSLNKSEVDLMFREIDSKTVIPKVTFEDLEKQGKIAEWRKLFDNPELLSEKQKIKDEISKYTISLSHYHKDEREGKIGKEELIYKNSKIFMHYSDYDYLITKTGKFCGLGLRRATDISPFL